VKADSINIRYSLRQT